MNHSKSWTITGFLFILPFLEEPCFYCYCLHCCRCYSTSPTPTPPPTTTNITPPPNQPPPTMVQPQLTPNTIASLYTLDDPAAQLGRPLVQVLSVKKLPSTNAASPDRYR